MKFDARTIFARITQFLTWPFLFIFFNLFFKLKITGKENLKGISSPFIIVANHISSYDSFVLRIVLGLFTNKLPLRFMAVKHFDSPFLNFLVKIYIVDLVYLLFGVFVIEPGRGIVRNLDTAISIIKKQGNVVMFPSGRMVGEGGIGAFKVGAAILAQKTGAPVLPISMRVIDRVFYINIGKVMQVNPSEIPLTVTKEFYEVVEELYNQVNNQISNTA